MTSDLDIGPLSWVKGEIDLALEHAAASLRVHADSPEGESLHQVRTSLHQVYGALAVVGLDGVIEFCQSIEATLAALVDGRAADPATAIHAVENGLDGLRAYLDDLMSGSAHQPLKLFPAYRDLVLARGLPAPNPAELFFPDLTQRPPKREREPAPLLPEALQARLKAARLGFERGLAKWIKGDAKGISEMKASLIMIEATRKSSAARALWWAALGVLDALGADGLPDPGAVRHYLLRLAARVRKLVVGTEDAATALMRETLYLVATATHGHAPLAVVRAAYRLDQETLPKPVADQLEPRVRRLRELVAAAKDDWNRLSAGTVAALPPFHERVTKIAEEAALTQQAAYIRLAESICRQADLLRRDPTRHNETLALEMATALLLAEAALDNFSTLDADFAQLTDIVSGRLDALSRGETLSTLELPHLDAMSRKAQERLLIESVAREIRTNLGAIEQTLDAFFRDPSRQATLAALQQPIRQIQGALAVLGESRAVDVLAECAAAIGHFAEPEVVPQPGEFEDVAQKLAALGFFVEQLQHGAADIDAILAPPASSLTPAPVIETEAAAEIEVEGEAEPAVAPAPTLMAGEIPHAESESESGLELPLEPVPEIPVPLEAPAPSAEATRLAEASAEELDAELLGIFLEEAQEVLSTIEEHLPRLHAAPHERDTLVVLRRSFHTLKGSGRMVGLADLGEAAWNVEQVMNRWLDEGREATPELLAMLDLAAEIFRAWVKQLAAGGSSHFKVSGLLRQCAGLRGESIEAAAPIEPAAAEPASEAPPPPEALPEMAEVSAMATVIDFPEPQPIRVGEIEVEPALFGMYLEETRGHLATLQALLGREAIPDNEGIRAAHTTASISAAAGFMPIHHLAHALEAALLRFAQVEVIPGDDQRFVFARCAGALEGMLGAVAERRMPKEEAELAAALEAMTPLATALAPSFGAAEEVSTALEKTEVAGEEVAVPAEIPEGDLERRAVRIADEVDAQLLPLFLEESADLMRQIGELLRSWRISPAAEDTPRALTRVLHTLKGSARMAGVMSCGELLHAMETRIEDALARGAVTPAVIDGLENSYDRAAGLIDRLQPGRPAALVAAVAATPATETTAAAAGEPATPAMPAAAQPHAVAQAQLRVRAEQVDRWVNEAGEIAIARARIEGEMRELKTSLFDLTENVSRLRAYLREVEIQAETQLQSRQAQATEHGQEFDPLELDRFTRFQEVTRMMAESVGDVSTVQQNLLRNLDHANAALAAQARLNRELSQRLMGARMVPFDSLAERLHRVVRQAAKDAGKRANLDIRYGQTEMDRSVLEKMAGPLEHLLRNSVAHGIEDGPSRVAAGKPAIGQVTLSLLQEGNEIIISLADDGAGLSFDAIRQHAVERGLLDPAAATAADEAVLTQLIFQSGFSTADEVTALAGRGVGMDVVKNETTALGGRIDVVSRSGEGATFRLTLPLTLAVTQAVLAQVGHRHYAIPSAVVEQAVELKAEALASIRQAGGVEWHGTHYPWHYLPQLLGAEQLPPPPARRTWLLHVRGGTGAVALEVDGLAGNQEIVVKPIGVQLARVPGLLGATVLPDGEIVFIINPVALLAHASERSLTAAARAPHLPLKEEAAPTTTVPTVMVVDDSLTVRKIAGRLLARHGYRVLAAKDGVDALEQLGEEMPDVMLVDIEMPRMDGFDLTRHVRADVRLRGIPIIMITSRTAEKHRSHAAEIGVNYYLGKPYDEDELLARIAEFSEKRKT
ncbi:MAG: hybrid sensor histidine kinase/response regulator [Betaproteobacteria bacterium HGW-Betaproteobacteria-11]|nr:MAG: hybrid sensor histidine kinase/response regulator [Betaproteobacteria bacterium HGW-Betaproteobacteria-11]